MSGETGPGGPGELPEYAERVLEAAEAVPPGRVMTYGDVAEWLGEGGPRQVGRVMALYGGAVPWWRVVRADGLPLPGSERRALARYREEGTPLRDAPRGTGRPTRIDMTRARWDGGATGSGTGDDAGSGTGSAAGSGAGSGAAGAVRGGAGEDAGSGGARRAAPDDGAGGGGSRSAAARGRGNGPGHESGSGHGNGPGKRRTRGLPPPGGR